MSGAIPSVSILIATYNRAALLDECLTHLRTQRMRPGDEVIVVDNGSSDDTAAVVTRQQRLWTSPLRLLHESRPGKSHAIARALADAAGDLLVFTDDDVNVGDGWLDTIRTAMADGSVALAGGPVVARWEPSAARWIKRACERYPRLGAPIATLDYGAEPAALGSRTLLGANLAIRRDVFTACGGYPAHLGKLRGTLLSGEDHELCRRVQAAQLETLYLPAAVVHHWAPAARARASYFLRWFFWSGITHARMDSDRGIAEGQPSTGVPLYLFRRFIVAAAASLAALAVGRRAAALHRAIDVAFAAGYAAERWGLATPCPGVPAPAPAGEHS